LVVGTRRVLDIKMDWPTLTLKGSSVLFHKKTNTNESHFLVFYERGTEITGMFFNFRTLTEPKPLQDFIHFSAIRNCMASLAESCKNSYCLTFYDTV
jgi:hypothetical protein